MDLHQVEASSIDFIKFREARGKTLTNVGILGVNGLMCMQNLRKIVKFEKFNELL